MYKQIILSFTILLLLGCMEKGHDQSVPEKKIADPSIQVKDTHEGNNDELANTQIAHHLVNVAESVSDVNQSQAIVLGPYAVVGIDVDKDLDRSRVGTVKYSVLEAMQQDPYGKTTVVVADGDIVERIKEMNHKIQQGYPVQGMIGELAAIVERYMPEFPNPEQMPTEPDQNKEQMPQDEQEKFEDIQEDQSNHRLKP